MSNEEIEVKEERLVINIKGTPAEVARVIDKYKIIISRIFPNTTENDILIGMWDTLDEKNLTGNFKRENISIMVVWKNNVIAKGALVQLHGCCGITVSTGANIIYPYRRKGLGKIMSEMRIEVAKAVGYGIVLCTDVHTNIAQRRILSSLGYKDTYLFKNPRTGNLVYISVKDLTSLQDQRHCLSIINPPIPILVKKVTPKPEPVKIHPVRKYFLMLGISILLIPVSIVMFILCLFGASHKTTVPDWFKAL